MKRQRALLAAAVVIFGLWTLWLAYEAATTSRVIIVSRPQLLMAAFIVEADVPDGAGLEREVTVQHAYRGKPPAKFVVLDLGNARGWQGPGPYILALQMDDEKKSTFKLVPTPVSPGFRPPFGSELAAPPIYPATESTRAQVRAIVGQGE